MTAYVMLIGECISDVCSVDRNQYCQIVMRGLSVLFYYKQKTAYEMRISDWSSDVCSSDLDRDRPVRPLLRRDPPQEGEIAALRLRRERQEVARQAVVNGAEPVHRRHRPALIVGYGHQRDLREGPIERHEVRQVEPPVQRRHRPVREIAVQRKLPQIGVEVLTRK